MRSIATDVRSITKLHRGIVFQRTLASIEINERRCGNALERNVLNRTNKIRFSKNLNKHPKQPNKPILIFFSKNVFDTKHEINKIIAEIKITSRKIKLI